MSETLITQNLILRRPRGNDWPQFKPFITTERSIGIGGPFDEETGWRLFAVELGHWEIRGYGMWAVTCKGDDTALGIVGPWHPFGWPEPEIGWTIFGAAEGKGIAYEAAQATLQDAYTRLGWPTAVSYIKPDNTRSLALAARLGAWNDEAATPPARCPDCLVYRHPSPSTRGHNG